MGIIVTFPPGGSNDFHARLLGRLFERLRQPARATGPQNGYSLQGQLAALALDRHRPEPGSVDRARTVARADSGRKLSHRFSVIAQVVPPAAGRESTGMCGKLTR